MKKHLLIVLALVFVVLSLSSCGHQHAWSEWTVTTEATCTADGEQTRTCECGETEKQTIPTKGHTPGAEATCTTAQTCMVCNVELVEAGHKLSAATCTEAQKCTVCNAELAAALGHNPGEWVVITSATKTENGLREQSCTVCRDILKSEIIPAIGSEGLQFAQNSDGTYSVSGIGTCTDTEIVIPAMYNGKPVTSIGENAFYGCDFLRSLVVPSGVTSIGNYAFHNCRQLASVSLTDSVKTIGNYAFQGCGSLTSIVIPSGVTSIGNYAFCGCRNLANVVIPNSVTSIGDSVFAECRSLTKIVIPSGVTNIGSSVFFGCNSLTSVEIPNSVSSIGDFAFYGCSSLQTIQFGGTITRWGALSFGSAWNTNTGNYTVICNNGTVSK